MSAEAAEYSPYALDLSSIEALLSDLGGDIRGAASQLEGLPEAVAGFLPDRPVSGFVGFGAKVVQSDQQEDW